MAAGEDAGAHGIVGRNLIFRIVIAVDDELASLGEQLVAVVAEVAELERFACGLVFLGDGFDCSKRRLINNAAVGKVDDDFGRVVFGLKELGEAFR